MWTIGRRYNEIADLHALLVRTCRHAGLAAFKFPNKSLFNTFAPHTLERRRSGFAMFFKLLILVVR